MVDQKQPAPAPPAALDSRLLGPRGDIWQAARSALMRLATGGWGTIDGPGPGWDEKTLEQAIRRGEAAEVDARKQAEVLYTIWGLVNPLTNAFDPASPGVIAHQVAAQRAAATDALAASRAVVEAASAFHVAYLSGTVRDVDDAFTRLVAALDAARPAQEAEDAR